MCTFSMPISMPWTSTTMSALQFQMIFKSSSRPSYLGLRTQPQASKVPFQVRSSFRLGQTRHTTPRPREWDPTATTNTQKQHFNRPWCWEFILVKEQRPKKRTHQALQKTMSLASFLKSKNCQPSCWFCLPCATPISLISGCHSPREKVLKDTVPKTDGSASC